MILLCKAFFLKAILVHTTSLPYTDFAFEKGYMYEVEIEKDLTGLAYIKDFKGHTLTVTLECRAVDE